jgi:NADPH-dependent 2,4-dienoyl-CoA reductase/sulfur reductase-like enzyme
LESVVVSGVDGELKPVAGTEREVRCDTLLLSVGLIPENELSKRAGVELSPLTGGAVVDETFMTSVPGIFSCGNVLQIHDVADFASHEGFEAGAFAARFARGELPAAPKVHLSPGRNIRYVLPQLVRPGTARADVNFRVTQPMRACRVVVQGRRSGKVYVRKKYGRLLPSELQKIRIRPAVEEDLEVECHE